MIEQLNLSPEREGTRFEDGADFEVHAGNPSLNKLGDARIAWQEAEMRREQARKDAAAAFEQEVALVQVPGARVEYYRKQALTQQDFGLAA